MAALAREWCFGGDVRIGRRRIREEQDHELPCDVEFTPAGAGHDVVVPPHAAAVNARHDRLRETCDLGAAARTVIHAFVRTIHHADRARRGVGERGSL